MWLVKANCGGASLLSDIVQWVVSVLILVAATNTPLVPAVVVTPVPTVAHTAAPTKAPVRVIHVLTGKASYYYGSRGFHGTPHVAMQNGKWTGKVQRYVLVSINHSKFRKLPVVDYCQCYRGTRKEKIIDLSIETVHLFGLDRTDGVWDVEIKEIK